MGLAPAALLNPASHPAPSGSTPFEVLVSQKMFVKLNQFRQRNQKPPLRPRAELATLAHNYAKDMQIRNFWGTAQSTHRHTPHVNPEGHDATERARLARVPNWRSVGENIASRGPIGTSGDAAAEQAAEYLTQQYIDSPGHRENMLRDYVFVGIGCSVGRNPNYPTLIHNAQEFSYDQGE
jgi:uncharacterized protein YkwD